MRNISTWAKNNILAARILIFCIHLSLILLAFYITAHIQFNFSLVELYLVLLVSGINIFIDYYQVKKSYILRKSIHVIASICFFLITCFFVKHNFAAGFFQNNLNAVTIHNDNSNKNPTAQQILESLKYRDKSTLTKQEKHILKKEFKKQLVIYGNSVTKHDNSSASKTLLIILAIIAALGLTLLLGALACSISCSGSGALAVLVFIAGFAGIAFGLHFLIKQLRVRKNVNPENKNINTLNSSEPEPFL